MISKTCNSCKKHYQATSSKKKYCDDCLKARKREKEKKYRAANREKMLEYDKKYYAANREKINERNKKYLAANREKRNEYMRKYRNSNFTRIPVFAGKGKQYVYTNGFTEEAKKILPKIVNKVLKDCIKNPSKYLKEDDNKTNEAR